MGLPSDYISLTALSRGSGSAYIDLGIQTSSSQSVVLSYGYNNYDNVAGYIFGARNTNSNSSAGQLNFYAGKTGTASYVGFASARISKTISTGVRFHISSKKNVFDEVVDNIYYYQYVGATASFSGTQNIYLFGMNNAGTLTAVSGNIALYGFRLYNNDTLVRNMIPVRKVSTDTNGMYDLTNDVFYGSANGDSFSKSFDYLIEVESTDGGQGFIKADGLGYVKKQYIVYAQNTSYFQTPVHLVAKPDVGYNFSHWEINGTFLSNEPEYEYQPTSSETIKAVFIPSTIKQNNPYHATVFAYGIGTGSGSDTYKSASHLVVLSGDITEDLLQRSTSTFVCKEIPDTVQINTPIFLYNPKGRIIYYGTVKAIENNSLICREPISIYDDDHLQTSALYNSAYSILYGVYQYLGAFATESGFSHKKLNDFYRLLPAESMPIDPDMVPTSAMPLIAQASVVNAEDRLLNAYSELNVILKYDFYEYNSTKAFMSITPTMNQYEKLTLSDGLEAIKDISVTVQEAEATDLVIYNSSGSTLRGEALMGYDGTISVFETGATIQPLSSFIANTVCKQKAVMSDDNLKTVALQNLNGSAYSHKITFSLIKNDLLRFEDLHLGQRVDFYYKDKLYESVITAWKYSFTNDEVEKVDITMGNVRTTLTAILNKKSKKK